MINDEMLEKLGFIPDKNKLHPDRYWSEVLDRNININENNIRELIQSVYNAGLQCGFAKGKINRSEEINYLLKNKDIK